MDQNAFLTGHIVREPVGNEQGYWVGAPGVFVDNQNGGDGAFYLTYRIRRPRGVEPDRGGVACIAKSTDGQHFEDIWQVQKDAYSTTSIERSAIRKGNDGKWRYFTSYVDPTDGRWCTAMIKADRLDRFDTAEIQRLFTATELDLEGVKDPFIIEHNGVYHMILSVALQSETTGDNSHSTNDIYNTGQCISATAMATSTDLDNWTWQGITLTPNAGQFDKAWDGYCRRINSAIYLDIQIDAKDVSDVETPTKSSGVFLGFYDGSKSHLENYEERSALATSKDLASWQSCNPSNPAVTTPHATGSIRYIDAVENGPKVHLFYEMARADGAHELRTIITDKTELASWL